MEHISPTFDKPHSLKRTSPSKRSIIAALPLLGIAALFGALICTVSSSVILLLSDGQPVDSWPSATVQIQPAVILAILTALANALLLLALREGGAIAWWVKMLEGATLSDCHRYWEYGSSAWKSASSGRHFNRVALGCLAMAVVSVDGPLLQRSSRPSTSTTVRPIEINAEVFSGELPYNFSGVYMTRGRSVNFLTADFSSILQNYSNRTEMRLNYTGCQGSCNTNVVGHGWDVSCASSTKPYNITPVSGQTYEVGSIRILFGGMTSPHTIELETVYKSTPGPIGQLGVTTCNLSSAIVSYPVELANGSVMLPTRPWYFNDSMRLLYPGPETSGLGTWPSRLGGIALAAESLYKSTINLYFTGIFAILSTGPMAYTYLSSDNTNGYTLGTYNMTWSDPMFDMLATIRELTFRSVLRTSNSSTAQSVSGMESATVLVYESNYYFLAAANAVMVLCLFGLVPLFVGWWRLGRSVSLSPVELAVAFQAPLVAGADSNAEIDHLLKDIGDRKVRYRDVSLQSTGRPFSSGGRWPNATHPTFAMATEDPRGV